MWNSKDVKDLLVLSGVVGAAIGALAVSMYVSVKELKDAKEKKD